MKKWAILGLSAALAACGGGGGGTSTATTTGTTPATTPSTTPSTTPTPTPTPAMVATGMEGIWNGTAADGSAVRIIVLDDGQSWKWVVKDGSVVSASNGPASASSTTAGTLGFTRFDSAGARTAETTTVTISAGVSLKTAAVANLAYDASYLTAPSLWKIYGAPAGQVLSGNTPITLTTNNPTTGIFGTLANTSACEYNGTLSASATGKKIFDVTLTPTGSACGATAGVTYKGIASYDVSDDGLIGKVFIAALNPAKDSMFAFYGLL